MEIRYYESMLSSKAPTRFLSAVSDIYSHKPKYSQTWFLKNFLESIIAIFSFYPLAVTILLQYD